MFRLQGRTGSPSTNQPHRALQNPASATRASPEARAPAGRQAWDSEARTGTLIFYQVGDGQSRPVLLEGLHGVQGRLPGWEHCVGLSLELTRATPRPAAWEQGPRPPQPPGGAPALGTGRAAGPAPTARPLNNGRGSGSWGAPPARHLARVPPWPSGDAGGRSASRAAPSAVSPQSRLTLRVTPAAVTAGQLRGRKEMERKGTENWDGKEAAEQEAKRPGKRGAARPGAGAAPGSAS